MGNYLYKSIMCKKEVRILYMGLNSAGKTTILYRLKFGEVITTLPSLWFNVDTIKHNGVHIMCWDSGLRDKMRPFMKHSLPIIDGIVFVVDSSDRERLKEALDDLLRRITSEEHLKNIPIIVLANKQDLDKSMAPEEIQEEIVKSGYLHFYRWKLFGTSALSGDGLVESLDWLTNAIIDGKKQDFIDRLEQSYVTNGNSEGGDGTVHPNTSYCTRLVEYFKGFVAGILHFPFVKYKQFEGCDNKSYVLRKLSSSFQRRR